MNTAKRYIKNSLIHIHAKWPGPNDARCCPAARKTAVYPRQENPGIYKAGAATQHWRSWRKQETLSVEPVLLLDCFTGYAASQGRWEGNYKDGGNGITRCDGQTPGLCETAAGRRGNPWFYSTAPDCFV